MSAGSLAPGSSHSRIRALHSTAAHHFNGRLSIFTHATTLAEPLRSTAPIQAGLRIVVYLQGQMWLKAGDRPSVAVEAPGLLLGVSASQYAREQVFAPGSLSSVHVQADLDFARAYLHVDTSPTVRRAFNAMDAPFFEAQAADAAVQAVAGQILAVSGPAGHPLFQAAKALELMALVLGHEGPAGSPRRPRSLTPSEQGRIEAAHALLLERLDTTPDLAAIARRTGLNLSKLNRGFRATYGMTPYAFLQEQRLQVAYRMLASEGAPVGEVALAIGYSAAHFATLFRRRFGLAPSSLVAARSSPP